MLVTLGMDSAFGTIEGILTSLIDMKILPKLRHELLMGMFTMGIIVSVHIKSNTSIGEFNKIFFLEL